jgi:hypothetical protein
MVSITPLDLDAPIPPRPVRGDGPIEYDRTPVRLRGEELHPVWWRGRQWAVTAYGIECLDGTYALSADQLRRINDAYPITTHVTTKLWVDGDDFLTAWLVALALHAIPTKAGQAKAAVAHAYRYDDRVTP